MNDLLRGFSRPGHSPSLSSIGWGEPATIYTECSCGWEGVTVNEPWWTGSTPSEVELARLPQPYQDLARRLGPDALLTDARSAYGSADDALAGVFAHMGYDPVADMDSAMDRLGRAMGDLKELAVPERFVQEDLGALDDASRALTRTLSYVSEAARRRRAWHQGTVLSPAPRIPEAVAILAKANPHLNTDS